MNKYALAQLTPLHLAVINNDAEAVALLSKDPKLVSALDAYGFTSLELAQFLGRYAFLPQLGGNIPAYIKIQLSSSLPVSMPLVEFEQLLHLIYRPFLFFSSYDWLCKVLGYCALAYLKPNQSNADLVKQYGDKISRGVIAPIYIKWIDDQIGYGAFADVDLPADSFVGEYTGIVSRKEPPDLRKPNPYLFEYPTGLWGADRLGLNVVDDQPIGIDPREEGNLMRFINHSDAPNLVPARCSDRRLLHLFFLTNQAIAKDTQLTFNYGPNYWNDSKEKKIDLDTVY